MMQRLFEAHEEEMLEGTEVLWEDKLSYYDLIEMKVTEGEASLTVSFRMIPLILIMQHSMRNGSTGMSRTDGLEEFGVHLHRIE